MISLLHLFDDSACVLADGLTIDSQLEVLPWYLYLEISHVLSVQT